MGVPDPADIPPTPELAAVSPHPVLVARCENFREDDDFDGAPCPGRLRYGWGQSDAACDTCGGRCGIAVASWERVEPSGDTVQAREHCDLLETAWGVIANAGGWPSQVEASPGWLEAAQRWRDKWLALLSSHCAAAAEASVDTVQAPDVAALRALADQWDEQAGGLRTAAARIFASELRALLGSGTTPEARQ